MILSSMILPSLLSGLAELGPPKWYYTLREPRLVEFARIRSNSLKINLFRRRFRPSPEIREISGLEIRSVTLLCPEISPIRK